MNSSERLNTIKFDNKCLRLPKPDPANITVLTPNLPNKPILPWTHFDSPWLDRQVNHPETAEEESVNSTLNAQDPNSPPEISDSSRNLP